MNSRTLIALVVLYLVISTCVFGLSDSFNIQPVKHPEVADKYIYAISGRDGVRVWGLRNSIFVEYSDGKVETFSNINSPIAEEGTVSDVAVVNSDIWVAQTAPGRDLGLFKYNGTAWTIFRDPEYPGLLNNDIVDINVDQDEAVWFGHRYHGLSKFLDLVNPAFKSYNKISHLFDFSLLTSFMQQTHLWIGTNNGILRFRTEQKSNYDLNIDKWLFPEFPAREAFSICDFTDDMVIAGTSRGLALFDGKKWSLLGNKDGIIAVPARHVQRAGDQIWIGSPMGLQIWSMSGPGKLLTEQDGLPANNITALSLDESGNLLVGTEKGPAIIIKSR